MVAVGDELAKAVRMAVRHQTDEVVVILGDSHGDVVITSRLVLGHGDRTVLRVGEAAAWPHVMNELGGQAQGGTGAGPLFRLPRPAGLQAA